ncbi:hypothetical protein ACFY2W_19205 [Streptomyces sp. NPDC001262]|uniref:DUF7848 domain-containing protein n=1 Tax=Streptomyces sp. NPDC001262 TaxID=3364552 RepID=UPI0036A46EA8
MTRKTFRFGEWTTERDPLTCAEFGVSCREPDCDASFSILEDSRAVAVWKARHTEATGHRMFWEAYRYATVVIPPPGSIAEQKIEERERTAQW